MDCPKCKKSSFDYESTQRDLESRSDQRGGVRRRRMCPACGWKFTTYEVHKHNILSDLEMRKYKEELSKTVEISRQSILVALDKILLDVVD